MPSMFKTKCSLFVFLAGAIVAGCSHPADDNGATGAESADDEETLLDTTEALSVESSDVDPVEDGVITDGDVDEASAEASDEDDGSAEPADVGCGLRTAIR